MFLLGPSPQRKINSILYFIFCYFRCRLYLIRDGCASQLETKLTGQPGSFGFGVTSSNEKFHLFHLCRGFKLVSFKVISLVKDCPDLFQLLLDLFKVLEMLTAMAKVQFMAKAKVKSGQVDPVNPYQDWTL